MQLKYGAESNSVDINIQFYFYICICIVSFVLIISNICIFRNQLFVIYNNELSRVY